MDPRAWLRSASRLHGRPAIFCGGRALTYADLESLAESIARALAERGAAAGDRVAALFPNCHLYLATYFAALQAGLVLVPLNIRLAPAELRAILAHSDARVLIGDPELMRPLLGDQECAARDGFVTTALAAVPGSDSRTAVTAPPEMAQLYYTSGTTGSPKGVILTRANLAAHARLTLDELRFTEKDIWLHAAPMFHLADAWAIWTATAAGASHVLLPRFEPDRACDLIAASGVTITNLVPTMLMGLLEAVERRARPLSSLRLVMSGGAPIAPAVVARLIRLLGCEYVQTYGLTETSPFLTFSILDEALRQLPEAERLRMIARTGRAARGVSLRVVRPPASESFEDVPPDDATVGEVVVRGETVTPGYWRDEEATREAFRGGWFHTGDLGTIDPRGFLNLVDRAKDVIITGGETVYSTEVEHALYDHPAVREAAVYGIPDDTWGESVRAAVVPRLPGAVGAEDLMAFCRGRIARYKCPRAIDLMEALPRTGSGKIDKKTLREPYWRGRARKIN